MKNLRRNVKKNLPLYVMFIPVLIYFVIFRYIPLFLSLIISVEKYQPAKGILESKWVGLQYYGQFINSIFFWRLIRNTLAINFLQLTIGFVAPIILALLLNEVGRLKYKKLVQTVTYLPNFISSVVVVGMVVTFLSPSTGLINNILAGLGFSRINFLTEQEGSLYKWYTEQEGNETVIYAYFGEFDPNNETVEINVRRNCFYPSEEGIGYITVSGFVFTKAATQWAPPTAYQEGMVGPHWSKGWVIEDCEISHSRCSGISLGKYLQPENDNKWTVKRTKTGTQTERDAICQAQREGWTKEKIGSHIVRRCNIHDCGQTGIVGHLGGVFSIIEDNEIHHINNKQELAGAEIGGIKMHAAGRDGI